MPKASRRLTHDQVVFLYALLAGLPAIVVALCYLWLGDATPKVQWTLTLLIGACWLGFALALQGRVVRPLQTMANLLSALREGDFAIRARGARRDEPLGDVMAEINTLSRTLQEQRLSALEATALLRTVMEEINIAIFAFDAEKKLRLANHAGQLLLGKPAERILGRDAADIGLADCLAGENARLLTLAFPGGAGRWGMRRSEFREGGRPHQLVVIADLSRTLREEELQAWQRIVRVLGHELNNSLAPIKSIAGSLHALLRSPKRAPDWENDMRGGLDIIAAYADRRVDVSDDWLGTATPQALEAILDYHYPDGRHRGDFGIARWRLQVIAEMEVGSRVREAQLMEDAQVTRLRRAHGDR